MKYIKYILFTLGGLLALLLIVALFLPSTIIVQRNTIVNRPIEEVFEAVLDLNNYDYWTPWNAYEKDYKKVISKNTSGIGSRFTWEGDSVGAGYFERSLIIVNKQIVDDIYFSKPWESKAREVMDFEKNGNTTKITWAYHGELDYPFGKIMGLFMDKMIGKDFQAGVDNIKKAMENGPMGKIYDISTIDIQEKNILCVPGQVKLGKDKISNKLGESFSKVTTFLSENKIEASGAPIVITESHSDNNWSYFAGLPVSNKIVKTKGDITLFTIPKGKVLKVVYVGSYDKMVPVYKQLHKYMQTNGLTANGMSWEEYISDPTKVTPDKLVTNVYYPVK